MITKSLGYCCPRLFFHLYPNSVMVATRLGVSRRAVDIAKKKALKEGCPDAFHCQKCFAPGMLRVVSSREAQAAGADAATGADAGGAAADEGVP